ELRRLACPQPAAGRRGGNEMPATGHSQPVRKAFCRCRLPPFEVRRQGDTPGFWEIRSDRV
ncbi:MAG: hypothetical protein, partial [Olavius algarvensis Gamma 1 endosymbiont]